jgi:N6-adenosine-specific RNA methylase IME4
MTEPDRIYSAIAADPPWPIVWRTGKTRVNGRGERHRVLKRELGYATMSIEAIATLPVAGLAAPDAHLYLWVPDRFLIEGAAARVARAWGFEPLRTIIWAKAGFALGRFPRAQHEALLVCRRGRLQFRVVDVGSVQRWRMPYENGARKHSAKPEGAYDLIERASPGPYLELFARRGRLGWDYWGDESLQTVEMVAAAE